MTPAQYLASLPEPIQHKLVALVRVGMDTDDQEKVHALAALNGTAEALFAHPEGQKPLELVACVGELIAEIYRATAPSEEVV